MIAIVKEKRFIGAGIRVDLKVFLKRFDTEQSSFWSCSRPESKNYNNFYFFGKAKPSRKLVVK